LRSDGVADEVVEFVLANPVVIEDLVGALQSENDVVRGRAADVLEKVTRSLPKPVEKHFPQIVASAHKDSVPMVRWHMAMLLGHLAGAAALRSRIQDALLPMVEDASVFVVSWVITSLTIIALLDEEYEAGALAAISPLQGSSSAALRTRAAKAMAAITETGGNLPDSWIKSASVRKLL
jgi:hypothetical protein